MATLVNLIRVSLIESVNSSHPRVLPGAFPQEHPPACLALQSIAGRQGDPFSGAPLHLSPWGNIIKWYSFIILKVRNSCLVSFLQYRWFFIIGCAATLAYANTLSNQFVWDDHSFITDWSNVENYSLLDLVSGKQADFTTQVYRPVRNALYIASYYLWGLNSIGYRFQAILIHASISVLVYVVWKRISRNFTAAGLAGLVFALHPIHTEAVDWTTASFDLFGVIFLLLSLYWFLDKKKHTWSVLAAGLAFFSYELTLVFPVFMVILDNRTNTLKKVWDKRARYLPYLLFFCVYWALRMAFVGSPNSLGTLYSFLWQRLWLPILLFGNYIGITLVPLELSVNRFATANLPGLFYLEGYTSLSQASLTYLSGDWLVRLIVTIGFCGLLWRLHQKKTSLSLGLWWFGLFLLPVLGLVAQPIVFAEKYVYVASIGACWFVGQLLATILQRTKPAWIKRLTLLVLGMVLVLGSLIIWQRNQDWRNSETLWAKAYQQWSESSVAANGLGGAFLKQDRNQEAVPLLEKAYAKIPTRLLYQRNLVTAYEKTQQYHKAIPIYQQILITYPDAVNIWFRLAYAQYQLGNTSQAKSSLETTLSLQPGFSPALQLYEKIINEKTN